MRGTEDGLSNGNPVRALIEDGLPGANIAQVGLASFANSRAMHEDAVEAGNFVVTIGEVREHGIAHAIGRALDHVAHCDALVIDCDIDVIDRSQFPAAPGARPDGMAAHDFFHAVRRLASGPTSATRPAPMRSGASPIASIAAGSHPSGPRRASTRQSTPRASTGVASAEAAAGPHAPVTTTL